MRVFDFTMPGMKKPVTLASMNARPMRRHSEEGEAMLKRTDVTSEEWQKRRNGVLYRAFGDADDQTINEEKDNLEDSFDNKELNEMYVAILRESGMRILEPGEVQVASTGPKSTAA